MHAIHITDRRRLQQYAGTIDPNTGIAGIIGNTAQQCQPARRARICLEVTLQPRQTPADYAQELATTLANSNPAVTFAQVIS